jgi:hypothetical protein
MIKIRIIFTLLVYYYSGWILNYFICFFKFLELSLNRLNSGNNANIREVRLNFGNTTGFVRLKSVFDRKPVWYYRKILVY